MKYSKKLVTKTHVARISQEVVYSGVVGAKNGLGAVRASALKQYGFLEGDNKREFSASTLAKKIASSPDNEVLPLYRESALKPNIFKKLSETFHGDAVSRAKLKQRAAELKVHPDETETCVDVYLSTMQTAELVRPEGDLFRHLTAQELGSVGPAGGEDIEESEESDLEGAEAPAEQELANVEEVVEEEESASARKASKGSTPRAVFTVNVQLDASLDTEKLEKQLALLKKYGAL
ncbi:hypothetical protein XaclCFBP3371_06125 [Xanthomonas euvesicatoria pv. citrumelonis]|nr:hypothetical protein XaclCFBP3371_06125 [Xanthomonas euvesicatoria pv. citrumelonis]TKA17397.1 hypothetical protein TN51_10605 [Xanthomonas euvesicatoria pv. citrumelonis]